MRLIGIFLWSLISKNCTSSATFSSSCFWVRGPTPGEAWDRRAPWDAPPGPRDVLGVSESPSQSPSRSSTAWELGRPRRLCSMPRSGGDAAFAPTPRRRRSLTLTVRVAERRQRACAVRSARQSRATRGRSPLIASQGSRVASQRPRAERLLGWGREMGRAWCAGRSGGTCNPQPRLPATFLVFCFKTRCRSVVQAGPETMSPRLAFKSGRSLRLGCQRQRLQPRLKQSF